MEIDLLGEPRLRLDGVAQRLGTRPKSIVLLALLIVRGEAVARAALAAALWPDDLESDARANLRRHLHDLQHALPDLGADWFIATTNYLEWNPQAPAHVDLIEYKRLIAEPRTAPQAIALYRGELLGSCFDESIAAERERLRVMQLDALADCAESAAAERDFGKSAAYAEAILAIDEFREDALRLVMAGRYNAGDRSGALASYEKFASRLFDELGAEPMFETKALKDAIVADAPLTHPTTAAQALSVARSFVGRMSELHALNQLWLQAARGHGTLALISGEAGIGKTHLAREVLRTVASQGGRATTGITSCPEATAYQPIIEALRALVPFVQRSTEHDAWLSVLVPFVPEIVRLHPDINPAPPLEASAAKIRLEDAIFGIVQTCSRVRPVAMLLEDLQNAHAGTLELIESIARRAATLPVIIIGTYRSTEASADSPLRAMRRDLGRAKLAHHFGLVRLQRDEIGTIIDDAGVSKSVAFADYVYRLSEGNPLFAWQLIQHYLERREPPQVEHAIRNVADAIRTRLDLLPADVRTVIDVAATIGAAFTIEEIAAICGLDEGSVTAAFSVLLDRSLIAESLDAGFEYAFTHALIGGAVYDATSFEARKIRHMLAANVLVRTRKNNPDSTALVANHWERAGETALARDGYIQAAEVALLRFARDLATERAQRALALDPTPQQRFQAELIIYRANANRPDEAATRDALSKLDAAAASLGAAEQFEALAAKVECYSVHGKRELQWEALDQLVERAGGDSARLIRAVLLRANASLQRGAAADALQSLNTLSDAIDDASDAQRIEFYFIRSRAFYQFGKFDEAAAELVRFRAYLDAHPSLAGDTAYAHAELLGAWVCQDPQKLLACAQEALRLSVLCGDYLREAHARGNLAYAKYLLRDTAGARDAYKSTIFLYVRGGHDPNVLITRFNYGLVEYEVGHIERAAAQWELILVNAAAAYSPSLRIAAHSNLAEIAIRENRVSDGLILARRSFEEAQESNDGGLINTARCAYGAALVRNGQTEKGLELLRLTVEAVRISEQRGLLVTYLTSYIEGLLDAQVNADLSERVAELQQLFFENPREHQFPSRVCWVIASAARTCGDDRLASAAIDLGRQLVAERLVELTDPADRAAYSQAYPNPQLTARAPAMEMSRIG